MRYHIIFLALLILATCPPVCGELLPPVPPPNIPVCADTDFFFWNDSSNYGGSYNKLAMYPQLQDGAVFSATVSSATGEQTIGNFITEPFTNGAVMAPGLTRYRVYLNVSSAVGVTTFNFITYRVAMDGTETRMFYGVPRTIDVDNILTPTEYLVSYARRNYTYFGAGERLLIRVNASTTSVAPRMAYLNVAGTSHASMAQIGYWVCDDVIVSSYQPQVIPVNPTIPVAGILIAAVGIVMARRRK